MTARINLLPHREMRRKQQQQHFLVMLGVVVAMGAAIWFGVHTYLDGVLTNQQARNKYLEEEIVKIDKEIAEINKLKEQIAALLKRKQVVETLQSNRAEVVHLLDQLVRQLPDGMYLKSIKQSGTKVSISGFTQSQARVSTLMRNLESSQYLQNASLVEIKSVSQGGQRLNEFIMNIDVTRAAAESSDKKGGKKG
ncbi:MAG: PilN domain-containing protein [Burkholderiales bacterium]|nr:PilN domain-containing protein [Burkholderiales bacterium]